MLERRREGLPPARGGRRLCGVSVEGERGEGLRERELVGVGEELGFRAVGAGASGPAGLALGFEPSRVVVCVENEVA